MRVLITHVDFIEFEPVKKEIQLAEETVRRVSRIEEALVLFVAVEKGDSEEKLAKLVNEVEHVIKNLKVSRVVVYPFAHLSNNLEKPSVALQLLRKLESLLKLRGIEVYRAPFGWCKSLHVKVKGHPLAEQLKVV